MRRKLVTVTLSVLLLGGVVAAIAAPASASASAAPNQAQPVGSSLIVAGQRLYVGSELTLQADKLISGASGEVTVSVVSGSQLADAPDTAGTRFATAVAIVQGGTLGKDSTGASPAAGTDVSTIQPHSARGCTPAMSIYATCIGVTGSGLTVSQWETDAYYPNENNSCNAQFLAAGVIYEEDYWGCGNGPGRYTDYAAAVPVNFPNKTQVCNYWPGSTGGKACATVHS
jgi:hypothetical protein